MKVFTIGFTKKTAEQFFTKLKNAGVVRLVDVRLNNVSQLAGFSKRDDLRFFLHSICGIEYIHAPQFAPTQSMLDQYKKGDHDWSRYESAFLALMNDRSVENSISKELVDHACLLCSEEKPQHCHRRLVAEYLLQHWTEMEIVHI